MTQEEVLELTGILSQTLVEFERRLRPLIAEQVFDLTSKSLAMHDARLQHNMSREAFTRVLQLMPGIKSENPDKSFEERLELAYQKYASDEHNN